MPDHVAATLAFRRWCWSHSGAVFIAPKIRALRKLLNDLPCYYT